MSFLAPLFLLGALAVVGPLIFHLIQRSTRDRKIFSSVMFLRQTPPKLTKRSRLEDILLLILRCLALALLALGFGRPFLRQIAPTETATGQSRRIVIVLDQSASMRREGLWNAARNRATAIARSATPADEVAIIAFGRQSSTLLSFADWREAAPGERGNLAAGRLGGLEPTWGSTHLGNALIEAAETLADADGEKKADGPRQIFLLTDLQAGAHLDTLQAFEWPKGISLSVELLKPSRKGNAGLQLVTGEPGLEAEEAVRVRVTNSEDAENSLFKVGWSKAGTADFAAPAVDINVPPGQSRVVSIAIPENRAGLQEIVLRGDAEAFDNTVHTVPPEKLQLRAYYFGGEAADDGKAPLYFLRPALGAIPRATIDLRQVQPNAPFTPADAADGAFFVVTENISAAAATQLREQMQAGKTVLFAPKTAAAAPTLGALANAPAVTLQEVTPARYALLGDIDFQHPLFSAFDDPRFNNFSQLHFVQYRRLRAEDIRDARVVARFDSGDPAVVEVPQGRGRLVVLLSGWNSADSMLGRTASKMVPLLFAIFDLSSSLDRKIQFAVGDPIPLEGHAIAAGATLTAPGGASLPLAADAASIGGTDRPGIYTVTSADKSIRFGVNLDPNESRTNPMLADELERFGAPGAEPTPDPARQARREALQQGSETESRQKLWRWFIVATLGFLFIESVLAGWTARRNVVTVSAIGGTES